MNSMPPILYEEPLSTSSPELGCSSLIQSKNLVLRSTYSLFDKIGEWLNCGFSKTKWESRPQWVKMQNTGDNGVIYRRVFMDANAFVEKSNGTLANCEEFAKKEDYDTVLKEIASFNKNKSTYTPQQIEVKVLTITQLLKNLVVKAGERKQKIEGFQAELAANQASEASLEVRQPVPVVTPPSPPEVTHLHLYEKGLSRPEQVARRKEAREVFIAAHQKRQKQAAETATKASEQAVSDAAKALKLLKAVNTERGKVSIPSNMSKYEKALANEFLNVGLNVEKKAILAADWSAKSATFAESIKRPVETVETLEVIASAQETLTDRTERLAGEAVYAAEQAKQAANDAEREAENFNRIIESLALGYTVTGTAGWVLPTMIDNYYKS